MKTRNAKTYLTMTLTLIAMPLLVACSGSGSGGTDGGGTGSGGGGGGVIVNPSEFSSKLVGNWARFDCQYNASEGRDFTYGETFGTSQVITTWIKYRTGGGNPRCVNLSYVYELTYNYITRPSSTLTAGHFEIDLQAIQIRVTPKNPDIVVQFNNSAYLGKTTWQENVTKTFSYNDIISGGSDFPEEYDFTILKMQDNKLFWGDYNSGAGTTPFNRPTIIDPNNFENRI